MPALSAEPVLLCGIALGSNMGDRLENLKRAAAALSAVEGALPETLRKAPVYECEAVDCPEGSPRFLNTVITLSHSGRLQDLLRRALEIETLLGRVRTDIRNAPRPIDIDLLFAGDLVIVDDALQLPHPRLHERLFVLRPLADLEPMRILPGFDLPIGELCRQVEVIRPIPLPCIVTHW